MCVVLLGHLAGCTQLTPAASSAPFFGPPLHAVTPSCAALLAEELAVLLQVSSQEKVWVERRSTLYSP